MATAAVAPSLDVSMTASVESNVSIGGEKSMIDPQDEMKGVEAMLEALSEDEILGLSDPAMAVRHFRAEKGVLPKAIASLKEAIAWRESFQVNKIIGCVAEGGDAEIKKIIASENSQGKMYVRGYDKEGRAFVYMKPAKETTTELTANMQHLVFNLEKAFACTATRSAKLGADPPLEKINILIDYENFQLSKSPPLSTGRATLDILQKFNPERVHRYYVLNPPMVFRIMWNLVRPFVNPSTKERIVFCTGKEGLQKIKDSCTDESNLEPNAGGGDVREFDSNEYLALPFDKAFDE